MVPTIKIIAAVSADGTIGDDGEIPWHYPKDLRHFKRLTLGKPVIMGRKTYESISDQLGSPLEDRFNIVLTHNPNEIEDSTDISKGIEEGLQTTEVVTAGSIAEATALAKTVQSSEIYVIGGTNVYRQFLPVCDEMHITQMHEEYEGDTTFPDWDQSSWKEVDRETHEEFDFVHYRRGTE